MSEKDSGDKKQMQAEQPKPQPPQRERMGGNDAGLGYLFEDGDGKFLPNRNRDIASL